MDAKFSPQVRDILTYSHEEAIRLGNNYIGLEHLFLGMLRNGEGKALHVLKMLGIDLASFKKEIEDAIKSPDQPDSRLTNIPLMKQTERALKFTYIVAKDLNSEVIHTEHLLMAILRDKSNMITKNLDQKGIDLDAFKIELNQLYSDELPVKEKLGLNFPVKHQKRMKPALVVSRAPDVLQEKLR